MNRMRLCDEYHERMGLDFLHLRHSSKFFLFFEEGDLLLSVKWIDSNSSGRYEFRECSLGRTVRVESRSEVSWSDFEGSTSEWLRVHSGLVFDEDRVFSLLWKFFVKRHDRFLSEKYSPLLLLDTLNSGSDYSARKIIGEVSKIECQASSFLKDKFFLILENYAYWLKDWS